jgi:GalNAc-alpha-(1->4)-GalNAc-alpha-(1->3)-diNAcBac-PP-undecaprenol alpha-1,4-N-acetyl-D-galactosaminyltransferase
VNEKKGRSLRVLWAVSSLSAGGAERMICELTNAFAERGHSVGVLTLSESGSDHYHLDSRVVRIALDIIWDSRSFWQSVAGNLRRSWMIRQAVCRFEPDVVVSFIEQTNVRVLAALLGTGIPVIASERIDPRRHAVGRAWEWARRLLYPRARCVVVQTEVVGQGWARRFLPPTKVAVIPNFVRALPAPAPVSEREGGLVLAVGRLDRQKGFDLLLHAFASSGLVARESRLTILGEGSERQALASLARQLGIEDLVSMPGIIKDPEAWMARCALFVLPSRYEGFPNALLEAMAMSCPVIAVDCDSGPREIIRDGENGLLVPVEDSGALARAMDRLMEDAALRERLSANAFEVRERFAKETIVRQWRDLIEEVLRE